jgi:hypothetical protein
MADGAGVRFVDLERGWTLDHEDLADARVALLSGKNQDYNGHGTAVLGQVVGVDNKRGGIGIAPGAMARVVSQWRADGTYSTAAAILGATQAMGAGDVLLLEAQTSYGEQEDLPVEVETAVFDAIRYATEAGIIVIEPAGNGGHDLDEFRTGDDRAVLKRGSADFRDSGAIMVGAASAAVPHGRLDFSCHGSRVDCFAWGEAIFTTGDGWTGNARDTYTHGFGGTSGASPIVAGAAVLLQSWRKRAKGAVFTPGIVRSLLTDPATATASANRAEDRIGVMPDLRAILERLMEDERRFALGVERYVSSVFILFGLVDDSPGVIWVPRRGPVPVDLDWRLRLGAPQRDLIAGLAVNEISERVDDAATRARLADAAAEAMRGAVERIARRR